MILLHVQWVYCVSMLLVLRTLKVHGKRVNNMLGALEHHFCMCWEHFRNILDNILNVIWWIHLGHMLRLHFRCSPDLIGGYIEGKMIQSLQCTQDVPTGFQDTSPPVNKGAFDISKHTTQHGKTWHFKLDSFWSWEAVQEGDTGGRGGHTWQVHCEFFESF